MDGGVNSIVLISLYLAIAALVYVCLVLQIMPESVGDKLGLKDRFIQLGNSLRMIGIKRHYKNHVLVFYIAAVILLIDAIIIISS